MYSEYKENIAKLSKAIGDIQAKAANKGRDLTAQEIGLISEMEIEIENQRKYLPVGPGQLPAILTTSGTIALLMIEVRL